MKELEQRLYEIANEGIEYGGTFDTRENSRGEEFVEVAMYFADEDDLIVKWTEWIKNYKAFARYLFTGKVSDCEEPLRIYWRIKPEISVDDDRNIIYARLLISHK